MDRKLLLRSIMGGALAGTVVWLVLYPIVKRQIAGAIQVELHRQIPAELNHALDEKLAALGITPTTMATLSRAVDLFGRLAPQRSTAVASSGSTTGAAA